MKLSEFLNQNKSVRYRYVGDAWGSEAWTAAGATIAKMIQGDPDYDVDDTDHPAYGGTDGWYTESENIGLVGPQGYQQIILTPVD